MGRIHPTADELVSLHDGTARPATRLSVTAHLAAGCADCARVANRLHATLDLLHRDALVDVPAATMKSAREQLRAARRRSAVRAVVERLGAIATRIATLLFDSGSSPVVAGMRGSTVVPVRQLVYEWEDDRFTLRVSRGAARAAYDVMGQILAADGVVDDLPVRLRPDSGADMEARSSATGEFLFDAVRPGRYSVIVTAAHGEVTLQGLELP